MVQLVQPVKQFQFSLAIKIGAEVAAFNEFEAQSIQLPVIKGKKCRVKYTKLVINRVIAEELAPWAFALTGEFEVEISIPNIDVSGVRAVYRMTGCKLSKSVLTSFDRAESERMSETLFIKVGSFHVC